MAYTSWSVIFGEIPSATKWNILGANDAAFNNGTGFATGAIATASLAANAITKATQVWNNLTGASQSITSTSFVDVTGITGSLTTTGGDLLFIGTFSGYTGTTGTTATYKVLIGATDMPNSTGFNFYYNAVSTHTNLPIFYVKTGVAAGTYTTKLQLKVGSNNWQQDTGDRFNLTVLELKK
jgi:hypothetical protein